MIKEESKLNSLLNGNIHIETNFFHNSTYESILKKISTVKTKKTYQPSNIKYGNRMQAMPCYESVFNFQNKFIINKIQKLLNIEIQNYRCTYRKIIIEELKKSQCLDKYGFTHTDGGGEKIPYLAAIMHLDQSYDGGTVFFQYPWDKKPDIYISAIPNRLIIYNANRFHAPSFDYSYNERHSLAFFFEARDEK